MTKIELRPEWKLLPQLSFRSQFKFFVIFFAHSVHSMHTRVGSRVFSIVTGDHFGPGSVGEVNNNSIMMYNVKRMQDLQAGQQCSFSFPPCSILSFIVCACVNLSKQLLLLCELQQRCVMIPLQWVLIDEGHLPRRHANAHDTHLYVVAGWGCIVHRTIWIRERKLFHK